MVARIRCGKSIGGAVAYNERKVDRQHAECIYACRFGPQGVDLTLAEKQKRFTALTSLNPRVKTNALHISLSFHPSEKLSNELLTNIVQSYIEKLGFGHQPYLAYRHYDAAHPHVHIVTTNIQKDGRRIDLHNIGRLKSETARKEVELEFRLTPAQNQTKDQTQGVRQVAPVTYGQTETKKGIKGVVTSVISTYRFTSLRELNAVLNEFNVTVERTNDSNRPGLVYSMTKDGKRVGVPQKASSIDRQATYQFLVEHFKVNKILRKNQEPALRQRLKDCLTKSHGSFDEFNRLFSKQKITAVWAKTKGGKVYGCTFIDHEHKNVFKGSDLGKEFSAESIMSNFVSAKTKERQTSVAMDVNANPSFDLAIRLSEPGSVISPKENWAPAVPVARRKKKRRKRNVI